jgi:hypothetical protein
MTVSAEHASDFNVRDYGASGDGLTMDMHDTSLDRQVLESGGGTFISLRVVT